VIASTSISQPYITVIHMEQEIHLTLQTQILVLGGKEVCKMRWHHIILSIQAFGRFKGKRKVNIDGLVDKICQITFANTSTRDNEDAFDCIEDDSDPKCLVKLLWFMSNVCLKEQVHFFGRESASVKHRSKSCAENMVANGIPYIKILPNNHYSKNYMDKWVTQLCDLTGAPPLKEKMGIMEPVDTGLRCFLTPRPP
jgi:hypothetical protein